MALVREKTMISRSLSDSFFLLLFMWGSHHHGGEAGDTRVQFGQFYSFYNFTVLERYEKHWQRMFLDGLAGPGRMSCLGQCWPSRHILPHHAADGCSRQVSSANSVIITKSKRKWSKMTLKCVAGGASPPLPPRAGQHRPSVQQDSQVKPQNKYFTGRFKERFYSHNTSKKDNFQSVFFPDVLEGKDFVGALVEKLRRLNQHSPSWPDRRLWTNHCRIWSPMS